MNIPPGEIIQEQLDRLWAESVAKLERDAAAAHAQAIQDILAAVDVEKMVRTVAAGFTLNYQKFAKGIVAQIEDVPIMQIFLPTLWLALVRKTGNFDKWMLKNYPSVAGWYIRQYHFVLMAQTFPNQPPLILLGDDRNDNRIVIANTPLLFDGTLFEFDTERGQRPQMV